MASSKGTRVLKVLKALKGQSFSGISNKELAENLGVSPAQISRDLDDLMSEGLVMKLDNGRFAHSIQMLQIAQAYSNQVARLQEQISETNQRIMAGSME
ncbi:winged helix-turn-helix transcriptional regulator [Neisseria shayeganii]|uniref:IclR helix-turn-helix domain superfamily protein n=1 Tax=Neisseria shayeganii 871 TaxID=1032488 RepID=G4CJI2_9NEIS|nr:winged helix-turn-helix transcriptional regulator [Neisseria shayeganii]EGY52033.1 IclR helix-turn-helix domain superfamily protein [Neisseria shayeganii 871]